MGLNRNVAFGAGFFSSCDSFQYGVGLDLKFFVMLFLWGLNTNVCPPLFVADYGRSFSDVVQGLEHIFENFGLDQISTPSSFKYRVALEKQVRILKSFVFKVNPMCNLMTLVILPNGISYSIQWKSWVTL